MTRSDKKNRTCVCCGKTLYSPHKLRQHYQSNKNQCTFQTQQPVTAGISSEQLTPLEPLQEPAVDQLQEQLTEPPESTHDSLEEPTEEEEWDYIDRLARKPKEHMRTWGSRLRQRWYEITGEKRNLPVTEIACKLYYNDLI